jgi:hypothetical protein
MIMFVCLNEAGQPRAASSRNRERHLERGMPVRQHSWNVPQLVEQLNCSPDGSIRCFGLRVFGIGMATNARDRARTHASCHDSTYRSSCVHLRCIRSRNSCKIVAAAKASVRTASFLPLRPCAVRRALASELDSRSSHQKIAGA